MLEGGGGGGGGGGGAVWRFRPDAKSGEGGGGGLFSRRGAVPYMKGRFANPNPPPTLDTPLV